MQFQKATEVLPGKTYIVLPMWTGSFAAPVLGPQPSEVWLIKTFMDGEYVCYVSPNDEEKLARILSGPNGYVFPKTCGHTFYGPID